MGQFGHAGKLARAWPPVKQGTGNREP
jgi:hypothetical protein